MATTRSMTTGADNRPTKAGFLPKRRAPFLPLLKAAVLDKENWLVRPDTTGHALADSSILKAKNVPSCTRRVRALADVQLRRICPGSSSMNSLQRQLHYYCFTDASQSRNLWTMRVEVEPGHFVDIQYARFTHVDSRDPQGRNRWSNRSERPHPDHRRITDNGKGSAHPWARKDDPVAVASLAKRKACAVDARPTKRERAAAERQLLGTLDDALLDDELLTDLVLHECENYDPVQDGITFPEANFLL